MLLYEAPVVYNILLNNLPNTPFPEPSIELVEVICKASKDPSLNKPKFKRYLHEYAQTGLYCRRPPRLTPNRQSYYSRIRKNKIDRYIKINQQRLDILKKGLVP